MPSLKKIVSAVLTPLMRVNIAGLVIGATWVGMTMQWKVIGIGIITFCFSSYIIPILLIPVGLFSHFMLFCNKAKQKVIEQLMFVLSIAYILLFLTMWCVSILYFAITYVAIDYMVGGLIWANSIAMLSLLWWINKDRKNIFILTLVETAQIVMLLLSAIKLAGIDMQFWTSASVFGGFLSFVAILLAVYEKKFMKKS